MMPTKEQILAEPAGRLLDAWIATRLLGWRWQREPHLAWTLKKGERVRYWHLQEPERTKGVREDCLTLDPEAGWDGELIVNAPRYSEDIAAAWSVHKACCDWLFSKRRRYLEALTDVVRQRVGVSVIWPDVLVFLLPDDFCRAALLALLAKEGEKQSG